MIGPPHRRLHVGLRGQVEDDVGAVEVEAVADVPLEQRGGGVHVLAPAEREVVDDEHLVAPLDEAVDEVRADEAGPTGDDGTHGAVS